MEISLPFALDEKARFNGLITDIVVLRGRFDVSKSPHLPSIPGYDLDINENIQISPKER